MKQQLYLVPQKNGRILLKDATGKTFGCQEGYLSTQSAEAAKRWLIDSRMRLREEKIQKYKLEKDINSHLKSI